MKKIKLLGLYICVSLAIFAGGKAEVKNAKDAGDMLRVGKDSEVFISNPADFVPSEWISGFTDVNGRFLKNVGWYKVKRELQTGESDKHRVPGTASAEHLVDIRVTPEGAFIRGKEKGIVTVAALDNNDHVKTWKVAVLAARPEELPKAGKKQYAELRRRWIESLAGGSLDMKDPVAAAAVERIDKTAEEAWQAYAYKGKSSCESMPWPEDAGQKGNPQTKYEDDAVEFRPAFQKLYGMTVAYACRRGAYYKNKALFSDIIHILDYLTTYCYTAKSQTDNWWTWEIGIPKSLVPALILLSDDLTEEQKQRYIAPVVFFQPDPFHGGAIGTASTHGKGYRTQAAANRVDCSVTALGIGLLLEDNEYVYLAQQASASTIALQTIEDSLALAENGFTSGYYEDGSYLDHLRTPYTNSYGVVVIEGLSKIASILNNSPWQYGKEKADILKIMLAESYGLSVYNSYALDMFRGRAVARKLVTDKSIGRNITTYVLSLVGALDKQTQAVIKNNVKNWLMHDPEYIDSLTDINVLGIRAEAKRILADPSIKGTVPAVHRNYPLMDRCIHRTENWLFGLSMYSSRIFNCEVMNGENLFGWHQGSGMTFLYTDEPRYYTEGFWNTINPFRLPGTTTVSKNIGNAQPDSSGFYQEGDFASKEDWVGGSALYNFGTNGMLLSGEITETKVGYEPDLRARKSYFMLGDEIVCLGAGITDKNSSFKVETTVLNRKLKEDASNNIVFNGSKLDLDLLPVDTAEIVKTEGKGQGNASSAGTELKDGAQWLWLESNTGNGGTGIYFPQTDERNMLYARKVAASGCWNNIGYKQSDDIETTNFFELWFDHGINPAGRTYAYVILPVKTETETKNYAAKPDIEITANTAAVQAVRNKRTGASGYNFWEDAKATAGILSSSHKASVTLKENEDGTLELAVSDPTMKNTAFIELELNKKNVAVLEKDDNVETEAKDNALLIRIHTAGTNGRTSYIKLQTAK